MQLDPLLDSRELEAGLGAHRGAAAKMRLAGTGPKYVKIGRKLLYDPRDVRAWLEARKVNSTSEAK